MWRFLVFFGILIVLTVQPVRADGGTPLAASLVAGPYDVTIYSEFNPVPVGSPTDISVLVLRRGTTELVNDATVQVTATQAGTDPVVANLTREKAVNKLFYADSLTLPAAGQWAIMVRISGAGGIGETTFSAEASRRAGPTDYAIYGIVFLGIPGAILFWFLRRRRQQRAAQSPIKRSIGRGRP